MDVDLNDVLLFVEVVEQKSFTAAGKALGLPVSAVSRRIRRLEEQLGFKLLHRTTRRIGLTDSGRIYHSKIAGLKARVEEARQAVAEARDTPSGLLRVTAPPDDGGVVWSLIDGFLERHGGVDLEIVHTLDYVDLIEQRIDVALRGGDPPDSTAYTAKLIMDSRFMLVASPGYLKTHGTPTEVRDLEQHRGVGMDEWVPMALRGVEGSKLSIKNRVRANRLATIVNAAIAGFGIAPVVEVTCRRELKEGLLVEVLPGCLPAPAKFWAVYPTERTMSAAARAFIDHVVARAQNSETPNTA